MNCTDCGNAVESTWNYCISCGTRLPQRNTEPKVYFNVFYLWHRNGSYTTLFGMAIFSLEDMIKLISRKNLAPELEYYVGSYREDECSNPHDSGRDYKVLSWRRIVNGEFGEDEGPRDVFVTYLETSDRAEGGWTGRPWTPEM